MHCAVLNNRGLENTIISLIERTHIVELIRLIIELQRELLLLIENLLLAERFCFCFGHHRIQDCRILDLVYRELHAFYDHSVVANLWLTNGAL